MAAILLSLTLLGGCGSNGQEAVMEKSENESTQYDTPKYDNEQFSTKPLDDTQIDKEQTYKAQSDKEQVDKEQLYTTQIQQDIILSINGKKVSVLWENNASVSALRDLLKNGSITINMNAYGGFEQVGSLPNSIVSNDTQITTVPGDIMLYQGKSIVIFYGENSWAYTRLGHINGMSESELKSLLNGNGAIVELAF